MRVRDRARAVDRRARRTVWSVVADLARYPEWNPFVVSCASTLAPGDPIAMRVRIFPLFAQPQREQILEHERRALAVLWAATVAARRAREPAVARGDGREARRAQRYVSHFQLSGWLAPLVRFLLGARLQAGFTAMSTALKARAEALSAERRVIDSRAMAKIELEPIGVVRSPRGDVRDDEWGGLQAQIVLDPRFEADALDGSTSSRTRRSCSSSTASTPRRSFRARATRATTATGRPWGSSRSAARRGRTGSAARSCA
jgi:hypothetical protein